MNLFALGLDIKTSSLAAGKKHLTDIDQAGKKVAKNFTDMINPLNGVKAALGGIAAGLTAGAITAFLGKAIDEASDAESALSELRSAVNNVGGDFSKLQPATDAAASSMQRLTRFSDDLTRRALATMITVSGDTAGSLKNIGLAADLAAFKHVDLTSAAEDVARIMTGNTRILVQYGIRTKDAAEGMELLRKRVAGFAEKDGQTFQGRLEQLRNAFSDLLEEIGRVITGSKDTSDGISQARIAIEQMTAAIERNGAAWRETTVGIVKDVAELVRGMNMLAFPLNSLANLASAAGFAIRTIFDPQGWRENFAELNKALARIAEDYRNLQGAADSARGSLFSDVRGGASSSAPAASGNNTPPPRTSADGKGKEIKIPNPNIGFDSVSQANIDKIGQNVRIPGIDPESVPLPGVGMSLDDLQDLLESGRKKIADMSQILDERMHGAIPNQGQFERESAEIFEEYKESVIKQMESMGVTIQQGLSQTIGDAVFNGFTAAFNGEGIGGILKEFGKTVLAGIGNLMTQLGQTWLSYGVLMTGLGQALWNPFTSGPAAIAIGAGLVALGAALGSVAHGTGRGTAQSGAFRESQNGTNDAVRLKFVNRPNMLSNLSPVQPVIINAYGPNDPKTQRWMLETFSKAQRR